jgi:hypothetical protein
VIETKSKSRERGFQSRTLPGFASGTSSRDPSGRAALLTQEGVALALKFQKAPTTQVFEIAKILSANVSTLDFADSFSRAPCLAHHAVERVSLAEKKDCALFARSIAANVLFWRSSSWHLLT